jgi:uncharacterized membrane protein
LEQGTCSTWAVVMLGTVVPGSVFGVLLRGVCHLHIVNGLLQSLVFIHSSRPGGTGCVSWLQAACKGAAEAGVAGGTAPWAACLGWAYH